MSCSLLPEGTSDEPSSKDETRPARRGEDEMTQEDALSWITDSPEHFYEDPCDRKGTLYEEVDDPEGDGPPAPPPPPPLPERPLDLAIPESLHLQKLSRSIRQTLDDRPTAKGRLHKLAVIKSKKVKEVGRIMRMGQNPEPASRKDHATDRTKV